MPRWTTSVWALVLANLWELVCVFLFATFFFLVHFGIFTAFHGLCVSAMWKSMGGGREPGMPEWLFQLLLEGRSWPFWVGVAAMLISHGISFVAHRKELADAEIPKLMERPYPRVVVMHVFIIGGTALLGVTGAPRIFSVLLVLLKIALDVRAHRKQHAATS